MNRIESAQRVSLGEISRQSGHIRGDVDVLTFTPEHLELGHNVVVTGVVDPSVAPRASEAGTSLGIRYER